MKCKMIMTVQTDNENTRKLKKMFEKIPSWKIECPEII